MMVFESPVTLTLSKRLMILTGCETEVDWKGSPELQRRPPRAILHRRLCQFIDDKGFRTKMNCFLLVPVEAMDTRIFSLTQSPRIGVGFA